MLLQEKKPAVKENFDLADINLTTDNNNPEIISDNLSDNLEEDKGTFWAFNPAIAIGLVLAGSLGLAFFAPAFNISSPCGGGVNSNYQTTK